MDFLSRAFSKLSFSIPAMTERASDTGDSALGASILSGEAEFTHSTPIRPTPLTGSVVPSTTGSSTAKMPTNASAEMELLADRVATAVSAAMPAAAQAMAQAISAQHSDVPLPNMSDKLPKMTCEPGEDIKSCSEKVCKYVSHAVLKGKLDSVLLPAAMAGLLADPAFSTYQQWEQDGEASPIKLPFSANIVEVITAIGEFHLYETMRQQECLLRVHRMEIMLPKSADTAGSIVADNARREYAGAYPNLDSSGLADAVRNLFLTKLGTEELPHLNSKISKAFPGGLHAVIAAYDKYRQGLPDRQQLQAMLDRVHGTVPVGAIQGGRGRGRGRGKPSAQPNPRPPGQQDRRAKSPYQRPPGAANNEDRSTRVAKIRARALRRAVKSRMDCDLCGGVGHKQAVCPTEMRADSVAAINTGAVSADAMEESE